MQLLFDIQCLLQVSIPLQLLMPQHLRAHGIWWFASEGKVVARCTRFQMCRATFGDSPSTTYRIAGIFRGAKFPSISKFRLFRGKFSWLRGINHTPLHPGRAVASTTRRFVGKYFVVRFSTMKTTKILPLENYPLYGIPVQTRCNTTPPLATPGFAPHFWA